MNIFQSRHPKRFAKFIIVGSVNFLIDFSILNILSFATNINKGIFAAGFSAVSFLIANINSYRLNKNWTFKSSNKNSRYRIFFIISAAGILANASIVYFLTSFVNQNYFSDVVWLNISKIIATAFVVMFNYSGYKKYAFKN